MNEKPKLKKFHNYLRNCKIERRYEINNYFLIYLFCQNGYLVVLECNPQQDCVETVKVKLR